MKSVDLRRQVEDFVTRPGEQLGRGARFLRTQLELWRFCARRLREHNLAAMSAALSFRTIFALIPTLVLAFLVLKSIGVVEDGKRALRDFLDTSGFSQLVAVREPEEQATTEAAAETSAADTADPMELDAEVVNVADQIVSLVEDVESKMTLARIGPVGVLLLIWTAMTLLTTLESSLNRVFEAPRSRALARRVILFWSAITLGPILIVSAIYFGRLAIEACAELPGISWLAAILGRLTPVLVGMLVVAAAYRLIPNTHVRFAAAFGGAVVSVPAWMLARWAFAIYVDRFVLKGNLYGVLGLLPLFLLWLNISWSIFLFGAELAHTATSLSRLRLAESAERAVLGPSDWLAVALAIARPFAAGRGLVTFDQAVETTELPGDSVQRVLDRLVEAELVFTTSDAEPRYGLSRPVSRIPVVEILDLADPRACADETTTDGIRTAIAGTQERVRANLVTTTLADLCRTDSS
jgi:membrane protein